MPRVYEHPSQDRAVDAIREFTERMGMPPTFRELGSMLGLSRQRAYQLISALVKKGKLQRIAGEGRGLSRAIRVAP